MDTKNLRYIFSGIIIGIVFAAVTVVVAMTILKNSVTIQPVNEVVTAPLSESEQLVASQPQTQVPVVPEAQAPVIPESIVETQAVSTEPTVQSAIVAEVLPEVWQQTATAEFQRGMSYVAWTREGYSNDNSVASLQQLASLGVEWVSVVPVWFQDRLDSTLIYPMNDKTTSDESLIFVIRKLHELNLKVMLKPHLDLVESEGKWRGSISSADNAGWEAWFLSYTDFILHYVTLAQQEGVEMFCVGTELSNATTNHPAFWRELIAKVRAAYSGKLTYAANWYEEFDYIEFWDALEYAGVDAYFPLVGPTQPTREQLVVAWGNWFKIIQQWQQQIDKPVLFTEIGYKSCVGATEEPWGHSSEGEVDLQLQADCYQALLETFYEQPWFYGIYWWYWGVNPKIGGEFNRGFTPQNKPAQDAIAEWYKKPVSEKKY